MQDIFGSVRWSLVFRSSPENEHLSIEHSSKLSPPPPPPIPTIPQIRWRKGELIGCGAFGHVYVGMNLDSRELLAVKQGANFEAISIRTATGDSMCISIFDSAYEHCSHYSTSVCS